MAKSSARRRLTHDQMPPMLDDGVKFEEDEAAEELVADRPPMRASAAQRQPIHEPNHDQARVRTRRRKSVDAQLSDQFYLPPEEIPEGLSYEWKRYSNVGQEDPFYFSHMREQGWEPVNPKNHPNWVPPGYKEPHIIKGGLILMERPAELTREARQENHQMALRQMKEAEQRLGKTPEGTLTRQHKDLGNRVTKEYVRPMLVEE